MKNIIKIIKKIIYYFFDVGQLKSYSQEGEDMVLKRIFEGKTTGFYVDVGAHHPKRFSNTYHFYRQGWRGINIEPNPDMQPAFKAIRKRDINLSIGAAEQRGELMYYSFDEPALNTFDHALVSQRLSTTDYNVVQETVVPVMRLDEILEQFLPPDISIDFLTIDVEGLDFAVLKSNDWRRFRPKIVLVEDLGNSLEDAIRGDIFAFMKEKEYTLIGKTFNTLFFENKAND